MVQGIGAGGAGRAAMEAALERMKARAQGAGLETPGGADPRAATGSEFGQALAQGLGQVDASVQAAERLPVQAASGELDFHEVAAQLKQSELSFQFAMQVRNKFVEAYREVMRMTV